MRCGDEGDGEGESEGEGMEGHASMSGTYKIHLGERCCDLWHQLLGCIQCDWRSACPPQRKVLCRAHVLHLDHRETKLLRIIS